MNISDARLDVGASNLENPFLFLLCQGVNKSLVLNQSISVCVLKNHIYNTEESTGL